jgi:hypothetical protein
MIPNVSSIYPHPLIGLLKMSEFNSSGKMPVSDEPASPGLRPLPRIPRRFLLEGRPITRVQKHVGEATRPSEDESSDEDEFVSVQSTFDQSERPDANSTIPPRNELTQQILTYLQQSTLENVYGDCLSGSRSRRYEPKWPMEFGDVETPLHEPVSQEEANAAFHERFEPLSRWHAVSRGTRTTPQSLHERQQILTHLSEHRQNRTTKPPPEKCSGNFLLYRNLPDAATELNVWSSINSAHIAIRREDWEIADRRITTAFLLASRLGYEPLVAKCWYWRGIVADGLGDRKAAAECFLAAMSCVGVYEEGELLSVPVAEYKKELLELLDQQDASEGQSEWSRKVRRGIIGLDGWFVPSRELPPPISYGSTDEEDEQLSPMDHPEGGYFLAGLSIESQPQPESSPIDSPDRGNNPTETTTGLQPLSDDPTNDVPDQPNENGESDSYNEEFFWPRDIDWNLMDKIEEAAQKSAYIKKETVYQLLKGCSRSFERWIQMEGFIERFDNYPDIQDSVAYTVLKYCQSKAKFIRPLQTKYPSLDIGEGTAIPSTKISAKGTLRKSPPLTINTGRSDVPLQPLQTPSQVIFGSLQPDITVEEKMAAYEQALLHHKKDDREERKSARRRDLERNLNWRNDYEERQAKFDKEVQEQMPKSKFNLHKAQKLVTYRNNCQLERSWGPEGVRPPTPTAIRIAREQERQDDLDQELKRYRAELTSNDYRNKWRAWSKLPIGRQRCTAEPIRPFSTIAWLEEEYERTAALEKRPQSPTAGMGADRSSSKHSFVGRDMGLNGVADEVDQPDDVQLVPAPLRPRQQSSSTHEDGYNLERRETSTSSTVDIPSSASSDVYADLDRSSYEHVPRELKLLIGMTAMSEAMKRGRKTSEGLSREDLVRLAEIAISMEVKTVEDISQVPFPKHDPDGVDTEQVPVGEIDLIDFSSDSEEAGGEEGDWQEDDGQGEEGEISDHQFSDHQLSDEQLRPPPLRTAQAPSHTNQPTHLPLKLNMTRTSPGLNHDRVGLRASDTSGDGDIDGGGSGDYIAGDAEDDWEDEDDEMF